jgi:molecular chaperone GrpE
MTWNVYHRPPDIPGAGPDETSVASTAEAPETPDASAELEKAQAEAAEWKDRFLRKAAEFENFRKRSERDRNESIQLAKGSIFLELLPVLDACERALAAFPEEDKAGLDHYRSGVELLYRQVRDVLGRLGVVPIEADSKPFDPNIHEALAREESADYEDNTVLRVLRRGYMFRDRLLRPAQVAVSTRPAPAAKSD